MFIKALYMATPSLHVVNYMGTRTGEGFQFHNKHVQKHPLYVA